MTPFGATGDDGIELTIMDVNNGKSYITNYDYYLAKGMTIEEIQNNPLCNQECIYRNTDIIDAEELLRLGREELDRLSKPIVSGTIETIDLNVFEGGLYLSPILCEKIIVIDKDINYSISCKITEIEFTYDNPLESKIGISNVIRYSTALKDLIQNSEAISEILTNGLNGRPNLNASKVKGLIDGHIAQLKYSMENSVSDVTDAVILFECRTLGDAMFGALAIGSRGILISTELDEATNQWVWTTAIDAHGLSTQFINAIEIRGSQIKGDKISSYDNSTWIDLETGEFNLKDKVKFVGGNFSISLGDKSIEDEIRNQIDAVIDDSIYDKINESMGDLKDEVYNDLADNILTDSEIEQLQLLLFQLESDKNDIISQVESISSYTELSGTKELTDMNTKKEAYLVDYNALVKAVNDLIGGA